MTWFGTDVMALGCIAGSALAGGAATFAIMGRGHEAHVPCAIEASVMSSWMPISHGRDARAIVVTPNVRIRSPRNCPTGVHELVRIDLDGHLGQLDAQLEELDQVLEMQLQGLGSQVEARVERELKSRLQLEEAVRQMERARVQLVVERAGSGGK